MAERKRNKGSKMHGMPRNESEIDSYENIEKSAFISLAERE